jgi:hypothetical protein
VPLEGGVHREVVVGDDAPETRVKDDAWELETNELLEDVVVGLEQGLLEATLEERAEDP